MIGVATMQIERLERPVGLMNGTTSRAEQRARQRRGGLTTLARLGSEAMTAPMRAGFRARFEREARELEAARGKRFTAREFDECVTACMRAHMARMTAARLAKQAERRAKTGSDFDRLMADGRRRAAAEPIATAALQRITEPLRLCVGCWVEMCAEDPFPREATSTLCARHLAAYTIHTIQTSHAIQATDVPATQADSSHTATDVSRSDTTRKGRAPSKSNANTTINTKRVPAPTGTRPQPQSRSRYSSPLSLEQL